MAQEYIQFFILVTINQLLIRWSKWGIRAYLIRQAGKNAALQRHTHFNFTGIYMNQNLFDSITGK
jgi:hypothetical protein